MANNREIKVISEFQYVLDRPSIFVGSPELTTETVPIVDTNGAVTFDDRDISIGMNKLFSEVLDNSVDACIRAKNDNKRFKGKIQIILDVAENSISISDNAYGFFNALGINEATGKTNVETAFTTLRSGTNFQTDSDDYLIGTNGVGGCLVNMLSSSFTVESKAKDSKYESSWHNYESQKYVRTNKGKYSKTGTTVTFVPRQSVFGDTGWDTEMLYTKLAFSKKSVEVLGDVDIDYTFKIVTDKSFEYVPINSQFVFMDSYTIDVPGFVCYVYSSNMKNIAFDDMMVVNTTICKGSPVRYIRDKVNKLMKFKADINVYYNVMIFMSVPRDLMSFGNQNKTLFTTHKNKMGPHIDGLIGNTLHPNKVAVDKNWNNLKSVIYKIINRRSMRKISNDSRLDGGFVSNKYFPAVKPRDLFIVEGDSALGSILQGRDPQTQGIYALKGKIKNCATATDISSSKELTTLIGILNLSFGDDNTSSLTYDRVIIATDGDVDGHHITALLINFFYKWYGNVIENGHLYKFLMPMFSVGVPGSKCKYYYSTNDLSKVNINSSKFRYLKGLGAMDPDDWSHFMTGNMELQAIYPDSGSDSMLTMAFGDDPKLRKQWLSNSTHDE